MKRIVAGLALLALASAVPPRMAIAQDSKSLPRNVDPRFGITSFEPTFTRHGPINPAYKPQPFPPQPQPFGWPQVILVEPDSNLVLVPGQWWWSEWGWVWVPPHWEPQQ